MSYRNRAAYILEAKSSPFSVQDAEYPKPLSHEIVIKSGAIAINPVDWKMQYLAIFDLKYPHIFGEDVAGEVVEVGEAVSTIKVGDRVCGYAQGISTRDLRNDTFQSFVAVPAAFSFRIPDNMTYEEAAVLPLGMATAAAGLYPDSHLKLPLPQSTATSTPQNVSTNANQFVLVWGGASSVGSSAIQLCRASKLRVAAVASAANHQYCKDLGAELVFDYRSQDLVKTAAAALEGTELLGIYDAVGDETTQNACVELVNQLYGSQSGMKIVTINPGQDIMTKGVRILGLLAQDIGNSHVGSAIFGHFLPEAVSTGQILPKPDPLLVAHGLEGLQKGVDECRKGTSARKVVVKL